jgi:hypothetical protein
MDPYSDHWRKYKYSYNDGDDSFRVKNNGTVSLPKLKRLNPEYPLPKPSITASKAKLDAYMARQLYIRKRAEFGVHFEDKHKPFPVVTRKGLLNPERPSPNYNPGDGVLSGIMAN